MIFLKICLLFQYFCSFSVCMNWDLLFISIYIDLIIPEQPVWPSYRLMMFETCFCVSGMDVRNKIGAEGGLISWWALQAACPGTHTTRGQVCLKMSKSILCGAQNLKPTLSKVWLENVLLFLRQRRVAISQSVVGRSIPLLTRFPVLTLCADSASCMGMWERW